MPEKRGKILVIRGGAIGDFILTLPAIAALRETFPETHLELLGYPKVAELARAAGIIDAFRSIEARPLARFFARNSKLDDEWSAYFESFNVIISYLYDPDDIFKTNVGRASKAQFLQAQHRPNETEDLHATAVFLKPLEALAIFDADPVASLKVPARDLDRTWIAAHPGSGSEKKNWPERNWETLLARIIRETKKNILLVGGEAEGGRIERLALSLPPTRVRLAESFPLLELAGLLAGVDRFIGHDSGITHISAALGVNTTVLWGPSNEVIWRPINPNVTILKSPAGLEQIGVDHAFAELMRART